jgi:glycosyltransferase involved in cell wall biosynthesis
MRVLHLTTVASPIAGAELTSLLLARELPAHGIDFEVCTISPTGEMHERLAASGQRGSSLDAPSPTHSLRGLLRLRSRIRAYRPHVLHAHLFHAGILGAVASRATSLPFVLTRQYVRGVEWYRGAWARHVDTWAARQAEMVVAISGEVKEYLKETSGIPSGRIRIVHNAADVDRFARVPRENVSGVGPEGEVRLVYVASLHPRKGHVHLLDAMKTLLEKGKRLRLLLVGEGAERAKLEQIVQETKLADHVTFLGWRKDVETIFATAHVYVHSALEEAFGIAIAEAMAGGLPVVATNVGGIPDVVADGDTGFLVPARSGDAFAAALERLVDDAALRGRLGAAGKARALALFSPTKLATSYAEVFRGVASDTSSAINAA